MRTAAAFFIIVVLCGPALSQHTSVYTSARAEACRRTVESTTEGTGSYVGECRGPAGFKAQVIEGDLRQSLNVITPSRKKIELNFWNYYSSFSSIGDKLEWRMKGRSPVAVIARYIVPDPEDSQRSRSYLIVSKIGPNTACVTDIVASGPKQNLEARQLADAALSRPCKLP